MSGSAIIHRTGIWGGSFDIWWMFVMNHQVFRAHVSLACLCVSVSVIRLLPGGDALCYSARCIPMKEYGSDWLRDIMYLYVQCLCVCVWIFKYQRQDHTKLLLITVACVWWIMHFRIQSKLPCWSLLAFLCVFLLRTFKFGTVLTYTHMNVTSKML